MPDPLDVRAAVEQVHRAYSAQADTFPPAVRGRMALLTGGPLTVVAAGARNLHLIGTRETRDRPPETADRGACGSAFPSGDQDLRRSAAGRRATGSHPRVARIHESGRP